ncbi:hypothetical protein BST27_07130 [Mycobacterium intermedium]|uniref:VWFA domain-containing protein n=1 Tax=Mycobacterium intermedium TaxID=28445 RepID=A0A1E3SIA2_MYCIE|nr:substrate-binding domain-containing protein [Mycobacterium intermedium]MCV6964374.1 substrate-binding domain-containing protein [Mycobacterium intermedium]ODR01859.1 hypothetical protein BHQ20_06990 [Mycobacterium intermedium]OPE47529.1 hypothetical protein BV508_21795 [Mycobacterium intermedium]ORB08589.1 hypothetical protein BST27_07130 [Mycobacterium intermedium]
MGRHSKPDPDDDPVDEYLAEPADAGSEIADEPGGGRHETGDGDGGYRWEFLSPSAPSARSDEASSDYEHDEYRDYSDDYSSDDASDAPPYSTPDTDDYPDFGTQSESPEGTGAEPPSPPPPLFPAAGQREPGGWRGGHRSAGGRRGVSIGVIVALVLVVVVVGTVIVWRFVGDALSHRSSNPAAHCVGGKDSVAVIADPSIVEQVRNLADGYNATAGPVGDKCVSVTVKSAGSDAVLSGFAGQWPSELGNQPGLWIPGSSVSAARLSAAAGQKTISDSRSLVTSPVVLAIRPELQQALSNQNWAALPGLQTKPDSLAGLNMAPWGSLRLALPLSGNGDATFLAGEAIAAASAPAGAPPTAGSGAVRSLLSGQPKLADDSLDEAMNALLKPGSKDDAAAGPVHAVITTEQQIFKRGQSVPDAKTKLASWLPPGPVALADYPTVLLSGPWLSQEQATAASAFSRYLRKPDQLANLAKAGFRVGGVKPPSSPVVNFPDLPNTLSVGDDETRATLADTMATPSKGVAATIMLDQSMPAEEGGKSRLANVIAALANQIKAAPPDAIIGLWTFDGHEGRSEVAAGPLPDQVNGQPRSVALLAALDKQYSSNGGAVSFTTLRLIYQEMLANYRAGKDNSILVITSGPHTDQTLDGPGLQEFIRSSQDPAKPVAVNVIDFGGDPDRATWEAVAKLSGGRYQNLATSASPELATAVSSFLS